MPLYSTTILDDITDAINTVLTNTGLFTTVTSVEPYTITDDMLPLSIIYVGDAQYNYDVKAQEVTITRDFPISTYHSRVVSTQDTEGTHVNGANDHIQQVPIALISSDRLNKERYVDSVWVDNDLGSLRGGFDKSQYIGTAIIAKVQYTFSYRSNT